MERPEDNANRQKTNQPGTQKDRADKAPQRTPGQTTDNNGRNRQQSDYEAE